MKLIKVWDLQTRIFHWSLAACMLCTLLTANILRLLGIHLLNKDTWLAFHIGTGTAVGTLLAFRVLWGFCGPRYSRFSSLRLSIKELFEYLDAVRRNLKTSHTGHNPAASWSALGITALGIFEVVSGTVLFSLDEGRGVLKFLYLDFHSYAEPLKLLHHWLAYVVVAIVVGHICGVLNETFRHKTGIVTAMITGKKPSQDPETPHSPGAILTTASYALVLSPLLVTLFFSTSMETRQPSSLALPSTYRKECASCHMAFPPNLLPAASWQAVMANLQDHFGDDASIDEGTRKEIEDFLVGNSAERSREEASIKLTRSIGKGGTVLRVTEIPYWKEKHGKLDVSIYRRGTIKSRSNCVACHKWAESGSFEDGDIRIPRN